jgi:hypothetical protein
MRLSILLVLSLSYISRNKITIFFVFWVESNIAEATTGPLYQPRMMMDYDECGAVGRMLGRESEVLYLEKIRPGTAFSTTNPTCPNSGSNPGRRRGKPATKPPYLTHGLRYNLLAFFHRCCTGLQYTVHVNFRYAFISKQHNLLGRQ